MRARAIVTLVVLLGSAAIAQTPPPTDLNELPDGKGRDETTRACVTQCHPVRVLLNRRSQDQWRALIGLMKYKDGGLHATPDEINTILSYLARYVGRVNPNIDPKETL